MCEYFLREKVSKIVGIFFSQENFRKSEQFCEHSKIGEDFLCEYFFRILSNKIAISRPICKNEFIVRAFFTRGKYEKSANIFSAGKFLEMRVYLRAFKNWRGFRARAFKNFGDKKAGKPFFPEIENSEEKKKPRCMWMVIGSRGTPNPVPQALSLFF